jgi:hypothetical protein
MARRRYTPEERAQAAGLAAARGVTVAGEITGIPKTTIQYWADSEEFAYLRTTAREKVVETFWAAVQVGLDEVVKGFRTDASLKDKAVALATVYDRHALLTGGATNRSESRDITGTLSDSELIAAVREAERITSETRTAAEAESPPEG